MKQISKSFQIDKEKIANIDMVQSYFEELSCKLCGNIPNEVAVCSSCFNIQCIKCPNKDTNNQCRCRRNSDHVKVRIPLVDALINKIDVHCKFETLGCQAIVKYKFRKEHESKECDYALVNCCFTNCTAKVYKKDLQNHKMNCDYRKVNCEYCDAERQYHELAAHMQKCNKRPVKCEWCLETFIFNNLHRHQRKCPRKEIQCDHCRTTLLFKNWESHTGEMCQKKQRNFYQRNYFKEKDKTDKLQKLSNDNELKIQELQEILKQLQK